MRHSRAPSIGSIAAGGELPDGRYLRQGGGSPVQRALSALTKGVLAIAGEGSGREARQAPAANGAILLTNTRRGFDLHRLRSGRWPSPDRWRLPLQCTMAARPTAMAWMAVYPGRGQ